MKERVQSPDLVIYIQALTDFLYERIMKRGREFEIDIPIDYLENLNTKYDKFFDNYDETKKIVLDATHFNYQANKDFIGEIVSRINPFLS